MKISSKKTMLTAAVLVTISSGSAFAATPGTVDSQDLFRANRLVTDHVKAPAVEEKAGADHYEASISSQHKDASVRPVGTAPAKSTPQVTRLRWETVDEGIAARNNAQPSFTLAAQKAKPVIITAADVKREQKLAAKEGRPPQELVGDVNLKRGPMPVVPAHLAQPPMQKQPMQTPPPQERVVPMPPPAAPDVPFGASQPARGRLSGGGGGGRTARAGPHRSLRYSNAPALHDGARRSGRGPRLRTR